MSFKKFISFGISAVCALSCSILSYAMDSQPRSSCTYKNETDLEFYDCYDNCDCKKCKRGVSYNLQVYNIPDTTDNSIYNLCHDCAYKKMAEFCKEREFQIENEGICPSCKANKSLDKIGFCPHCHKALFCRDCYDINANNHNKKHCIYCKEPILGHYFRKNNRIDILTPFLFNLDMTNKNLRSGFASWNAFVQSLINRNVGLLNSSINSIFLKKTASDPLWIFEVNKK